MAEVRRSANPGSIWLDIVAGRCHRKCVSSELEPVCDDEHFAVFHDPDRSILVSRRKRSGAMTPEYVLSWGRQMIAEAEARGHQPGTVSLVIDARVAVGNSDPAFEGAVQESRARLLDFFAVIVNVVKTKVGEMQHQRMHDAPESRSRSLVTTDEDQAMRWAAERARAEHS